MEDLLAAVKTNLDGGLRNLDFLPSGSKTPNPSSLLFSESVDRVFASIAKLDYSYVIVDGAPLIGISDSHSLARRADGVLIVSRLERDNTRRRDRAARRSRPTRCSHARPGRRRHAADRLVCVRGLGPGDCRRRRSRRIIARPPSLAIRAASDTRTPTDPSAPLDRDGLPPDAAPMWPAAPRALDR